MKIKRFLSAVLCIVISIVLSGCTFFATDTAELLSPPALSGDLAPIADILKESVTLPFSYKYPSTGKYLSPVTKADLDNDGNYEAVAFYSTVDGETTAMHVNVFTKKNNKWKSVAEQKIVAGGVDRIDFCDLDNDGNLEILVGWEIYGTSEMQLAVYSFDKKTLSQRMLQRYTYFLCCDLNEDSKNELFIVNFNSGEATNHAGLYSIKGEGVTEISGCSLDNTVKSVNEPVLSTLSNGKKAIYIDEIKGAGAITEVLYMEKNELVNPLLNTETRENTRTIRSSAIMCKDINDDGILEIPIYESLPSVPSKNNENLYYTNWCSYNGESLTNKRTTIMNLNDGYYLNVPVKWVGKIAALKDTENRIRTFYRYDSETQTVGKELLYIQTFDSDDWDDGKYTSLKLTEIIRTDSTVYAGWTNEGGDEMSVTLEEIKNAVKLIEE